MTLNISNFRYTTRLKVQSFLKCLKLANILGKNTLRAIRMNSKVRNIAGL